MTQQESPLTVRNPYEFKQGDKPEVKQGMAKYQQKNVKTAWILVGVAALFFVGMMLKVTLWGGPELKSDDCDVSCQKYKRQIKTSQP